MRYILCVVVSLLFFGCSTKTLPPLKKYTINYSVNVGSFAKSKKYKSIKILLPKSSIEIMSRDIIYQKGFEKNVYYFSKWFETPNQMLYKLLFETINRSGMYENIYLKDEEAKADLVLYSQIIKFLQKFKDKKSYIEIEALFVLKNRSDKIISQKIFIQKVPCKSLDALGGIKAFDVGLKKLAKEILVWLNIQNQQL